MQRHKRDQIRMTRNRRWHTVYQRSDGKPAYSRVSVRCDRGKNFTGAKAELDKARAELDQHKVEKYAHKQGCEWLFNPPHASHFGGAWEWQIGTICRILDAMFADLGSAQLTHELLVTLTTEVTAIVNACPNLCHLPCF